MSIASAPPRDPIAIIGAGCRLPGASGPSAFWDVLAGERDAVGEIPPGRFPGAGGIGTRAGGFLDDIDSFDASFFSISPHEALRIDPQHRLLIEVTWEAIEDAGIPLRKLAGSRTAVYTSCLWSDYWDRLRGAGMYDMHAAIGGGNWGNLPGRISYLFDLRGPSMSVEATCSTSLVAVHLACREMWAGQTDMAVVGGVNLLMAPDIYLGLSDAGILSPEGRCRFGDADADGYVRSEAVVSLLLKPLRRALADGDRVYASIIGTAVNSNGRGAGTLIAAGVSGQEAMLREAYRDAGVRPGQIGYVEAHGPGTPSGDLTELTALARVMGEGREPGQRCLVGSAKSNIGHGEGAAGLVGLLKAALALRHRTVPATLNVRRPHPLFEQPGMPLELVRRTREWPERSWPAMAGVSSFGLSATNAHVVLAEAPKTTAAARRRRSGTYLLPLSARDERALPDLALRYADALQPSNSSPHDLCFSAGDRRSHHGHRVAVVGTNGRGIAAALRSYAAGAAPQSVVTGTARAGATPKVVYVFPGQGAQWPGMARDLLDDNPVFARRLRECDRAIHDELGWSLIDLLREGRPLAGTDEIQPALWAIQVALASVWAAWGIRPDLVIGHSMGEIAAATVSGALTVRQGAAVVCRRSRLLTRLGGSGAMWAVQVGEPHAREAIGENAARVCVAVVNSVHSCVLAGDADALGEVVERLRRDGAFCKQVQVAYASHAPQMEPIRDDLIEALAELRPRPGAVPMHSTMLDEMVDGSQLDAGYWMENLRRPVSFASAVRAALPDEGAVLFIEISPHPLLSSAIEDEIAAADGAGTVIPSLCRDEPELECMLRSLGVAYVQGCDPDWSRLYPGGRFTPLPGYPWQRRRFWVDPQDSAVPAFAAAALPATTGPRTVPGVEAGPGPDDVAVPPVLVSSASVSPVPPASSVSPAPPVSSVSVSSAAVGDVGAGPAALVAPGPVAALPAVPVPEAAAAGPYEGGTADPPLTDRSVAAAAITRYVVMRSARILGMSPDELDLDSPITVHGLDSVLAAKLSAQIQADLGVHVRVGELLRHRPLSNLTGELYEAASLRASGR